MDLVKNTQRRGKMNEIAERVTEIDRARMKDYFIISSQYELSFWEMAYKLEKWQVEPISLEVV
jgi:thiaminase/transcriptional activator TenA